MKTHVYLFTEKGIAANYGVGTYLSFLLNIIKKESDFKITIVELLSNKKEIEVCENENVRHLYIPANIKEKKYYYRNVFYILHRYIDKRQRLIFHLNFMSCRDLAIILKSHYFNARILLTIHYSLCDIAGVQSKEVRKEEFGLIENCDKIIVLSEHRYNFLIENYEIPSSKVAIIPHGIFDEYEELQKEKATSWKQFGLKNEKILLYAGRLDENKRVGLLIKAFRIVESLLSNVHLVIIGEGSLLPSLLQECKSLWGKITFTGFLDRKELLKLYTNASVGVLPSRYEEFGFVALEMMMCALPIVANNTTGLADILQRTEAGRLVSLNGEIEDEMVQLLAQAIIELLTDENLLQRYGECARERFLMNYTFSDYRMRMLEIYNEQI